VLGGCCSGNGVPSRNCRPSDIDLWGVGALNATCYIMSACSNRFALTATPASHLLRAALSERISAVRIDQIGLLGAVVSSCSVVKRLAVSEGREELTTKAATCC
jgi:hypothetical protein